MSSAESFVLTPEQAREFGNRQSYILQGVFASRNMSADTRVVTLGYATEIVDGPDGKYCKDTNEMVPVDLCQQGTGFYADRMFEDEVASGRAYQTEHDARVAAKCFEATMRLATTADHRVEYAPLIESRVEDFDVVRKEGKYGGFVVTPRTYRVTRVPVTTQGGENVWWEER
jgi:hypothetical protein